MHKNRLEVQNIQNKDLIKGYSGNKPYLIIAGKRKKVAEKRKKAVKSGKKKKKAVKNF